MGTVERRNRERDDLRRKIMDAARDLFARHGYEAVTMRGIAQAIEYSPTAIYAHFKDKETLFRELCRQDYDALHASWAPLADVADPVEQIRLVGHAYVRFALEYPNHYRLMFMTPRAPGPVEEDLVKRGNPDLDSYALFRRMVEKALAAGRLRPGVTDPDLVTQVFWAGVHGIVSLQIIKKDDPWLEWRPVEDRAKLMIDTLVAGLTSPEPAGAANGGAR